MPESTITGTEVELYLYAVLPPRPPVLEEMEQRAREEQIPIVGPAVGRLLQLLAAISGARRVFELGSAIGYSTLWWAAGVGDAGEVYYTDNDAERAAAAAGYFRRSGLGGRVRLLVGDAFESLASTAGEFDIIFCDLEKTQYPEALRRALPRLRVGGLLVADNVLWSGRVAAAPDSAETAAMVEFNRAIYASPQLFPVILPLRDGVAVCRKTPPSDASRRPQADQA